MVWKCHQSSQCQFASAQLDPFQIQQLINGPPRHRSTANFLDPGPRHGLAIRAMMARVLITARLSLRISAVSFCIQKPKIRRGPNGPVSPVRTTRTPRPLYRTKAPNRVTDMRHVPNQIPHGDRFRANSTAATMRSRSAHGCAVNRPASWSVSGLSRVILRPCPAGGWDQIHRFATTLRDPPPVRRRTSQR